jgi:hypothetical protein
LAESFVTTTFVIWWISGLLAATRSSDSRASAENSMMPPNELNILHLSRHAA